MKPGAHMSMERDHTGDPEQPFEGGFDEGQDAEQVRRVAAAS
jgi:hypothetical protein